MFVKIPTRKSISTWRTCRRKTSIYTTRHLATHYRKTINEFSILEASRHSFWIIFHDISGRESLRYMFSLSIHALKVLEYVAVHIERKDRLAYVVRIHYLSLQNVFATSITFEVKIVNMLSRSSNKTSQGKIQFFFF